jgi:tRNA dimethylallyltransferase
VENSTSKIIVLCGPTAVGKTDLSLIIAETFSCEIVGVDSMQVYRHMDIGTAKPTQAERARINHYLIDIVDPDDNYSLGRFVKDAQEAIRKINSHNNIPLLVGGTGLYLKGLLQGLFAEDDLAAEADDYEGKSRTEYVRDDLRKRLMETGNETLHRELAEVDPDSAERIHPNDTQRLLRGLEIFYTTGIPWSRHLTDQRKNTKQYQTLKIGLTRPRQELYERIDKRVCLMAEQGLLGEVKMLLAMGYAKELKTMQSIGYRHMINFLDNKWTWEQTLELLARDTRHFAKRQFTWFNNDKEISWYDVRQQDTILKKIKRFLLQDSFS